MSLKMNFGICAIFKNEARYLREWIEFHLIQGFDHFYLYNNGSDDEYADVLQPYLSEGVVSLKDWDHPLLQGYSHQIEAYRDCLRSAHTRWVAFIDVDEFLYAGNCDRFVDAMKQYEAFVLAL